MGLIETQLLRSIDRKLDFLLDLDRKLDILLARRAEMSSDMAQTLDDILNAVTQESTDIASLNTFINGLQAQINAANGNQSQIDQIFAEVKANDTSIVNAMQANTPAAVSNAATPDGGISPTAPAAATTDASAAPVADPNATAPAPTDPTAAAPAAGSTPGGS